MTNNTIHEHTLKTTVNDCRKHADNTNKIGYIDSINNNTHLLICKKKLIQCVFIPLRNERIEKQLEICRGKKQKEKGRGVQNFLKQWPLIA